jgi:hypothetical protein
MTERIFMWDPSILWYISLQGEREFPPPKFFGPHKKYGADTSCVTGLPARTNHRLCRLFFALKTLLASDFGMKKLLIRHATCDYDTQHEANLGVCGSRAHNHSSVGTVDEPVGGCASV